MEETTHDEGVPVYLVKEPGASFQLDNADGSLTVSGKDVYELRETLALLFAFDSIKKVLGTCKIDDLSKSKDLFEKPEGEKKNVD